METVLTREGERLVGWINEGWRGSKGGGRGTYMCRRKPLLATPPLTTKVFTPSAFCSKSLKAQPTRLAICSNAILILSLASSLLSSWPISTPSLLLLSQILLTALSSPENVNSMLRLFLPLRVSDSGGTRDQPYFGLGLRAISWARVWGAV